MATVLGQYVVRPLRTVLANGSVVLIILLAFGLDRVSSDPRVSLLSSTVVSPVKLITPSWAYVELPAAITALANSGWLLTIAAALFLVQAVVGLAIIYDFRFMYARQRRGLLASLRRIPPESVGWYCLWAGGIHLLYIGIAAAFYLPSLWLWQVSHINTLVSLVAIAALFFPSYYAFQSIGAKVAALPLGWRTRLSRMRFLLKPQSLKRVYVFYPIRLAVEFVVWVGISTIAFALFSNRFIAFLAGMLALLVPVAALRASTFEFFLDLYRADPVVQATFAEHFRIEQKALPNTPR